MNVHCLFVLEVLKAWIDPAQKNARTIHHHGYGKFVVDGEAIKLQVENAIVGISRGDIQPFARR